MTDVSGLIDAPGLVALYLSAVMLGAMVFFSGIVAPTVFTTLEPQPAARLIRRIFPRYYLLIILTGFVTALKLLIVLVNQQ